MPEFRKPYTRNRVRTVIDPESMTKQSFKDESDINFIMRKYSQTGFLNPALLRDADYLDVENLSFQEAMNIVVSAQDDFDSLPSVIRKRFGNDPAQFLDFVGDEANIEEMRTLGLIPKENVIQANSEPSRVTTVSSGETSTPAAENE